MLCPEIKQKYQQTSLQVNTKHELYVT